MGMAGCDLGPRSGPASCSQVLEMLQEQGRRRACSRSMWGLQPPCHAQRDAKLTATSNCPPIQRIMTKRLWGEQTGEGTAHPEHLGEWELYLTSLQTMHEASFPIHPPLRAPLLLSLSLGTGIAPCLPFSSPVLLIPC